MSTSNPQSQSQSQTAAEATDRLRSQHAESDATAAVTGDYTDVVRDIVSVLFDVTAASPGELEQTERLFVGDLPQSGPGPVAARIDLPVVPAASGDPAENIDPDALQVDVSELLADASAGDTPAQSAGLDPPTPLAATNYRMVASHLPEVPPFLGSVAVQGNRFTADTTTHRLEDAMQVLACRAAQAVFGRPVLQQHQQFRSPGGQYRLSATVVLTDEDQCEVHVEAQQVSPLRVGEFELLVRATPARPPSGLTRLGARRCAWMRRLWQSLRVLLGAGRRLMLK